jgi:hypothetical protein
MKPFDLEAAKRGEPIICRDGTPAKFVAHVPEKIGEDTVLVLMRGAVHTYYENGFYLDSHQEDIYDLLMVGTPTQREWIGLTDEDIKECDDLVDPLMYRDEAKPVFARAIEAKLKEKNHVD